MDESIHRTIEADGFARVLVTLNALGAAAEAAGRDISQYFVPVADWQSESQDGRLISPTIAGVYKPLVGGAAKRAASPTRQSEKLRVYPRLGLAIGTIDQTGAAALARQGAVNEVLSVEQPRLIRPMRAELAAASAETSWGVARIRAPELWAMGHTGEGVIVGHVDTGVDGRHPALHGAIHAFARLELNGDLTPDVPPFDSGDHGTHTAGTILGRSGAHGTFGVAPGAKLASAMVIEGGDVSPGSSAGSNGPSTRAPACSALRWACPAADRPSAH